MSLLASPGEPRVPVARAAFAAYGLLVMAGASALRQYAGRQGNTLIFCVTLCGAACVIAGVALKDRPGAPHTTVSQVHVTAAIVAGALAIAAMTLVSACGPTQAVRGAGRPPKRRREPEQPDGASGAHEKLTVISVHEAAE